MEPLDPPAGAVPGDRVVSHNHATGQPDDELKAKQKVWETLQPDLLTTEAKVASWKGSVFEVPNKGVVTAKSLAKATIK